MFVRPSEEIITSVWWTPWFESTVVRASADATIGMTRGSWILSAGANSCNPEHVGYALQELSQMLFYRTGAKFRAFEPVPADEIQGLEDLLSDLELMDTFSTSMWYLDRN